MRRPGAIATDAPRFGWHFREAQQAFEIELRDADRKEVLAGSGKVLAADCAFVSLPGLQLAPRTAYSWRVRCWNALGEASQWAEAEFETGFLQMDEWRAQWIEPVQSPVVPEISVDARAAAMGDYPIVPPEERLHPPQMIRQSFLVGQEIGRARLYITAHGLFEILINGRAITDEIFAPGYDAHPHRLSVHTYPVTEFLHVGLNAIGITLADGWWAGRTSFSGDSANYGNRLGVTWQIEIDGEVVATGDETAVAAQGPTRYADIFIGEKHDARDEIPGWASAHFDASGWTPVEVKPRDVTGLVPFIGEPVRRVMEFAPAEVRRTPNGELLIDLGQNIAGRLRIGANGPAGTEIIFEHSETLDAEGNFIKNIMGRNKDQTDIWILAGGGDETFEPRFTYHGFRYVRVSGYPGKLIAANVTAVVIASDLDSSGSFEVDHWGIHRLHQNVVWSQRSNFLSIPTDCPQRERAGWTGDIQLFAPAATNNMLVHQFLSRWLENVRAAQAPDGRIPLIVPDTPSFARMMPFASQAAAGWSDAIAIVPLVLFDRYGDLRPVADNYAAMTAWLGHARRLAMDGIPERYLGEPEDSPARERQRHLWNTGFQFGDWLAPSTVSADPMSMWNAARLTGGIVGSIFYYRTTEAVRRAAGLLGDVAAEAELGQRAAAIRQAFSSEFIGPEGRLDTALQGPLVLALAFGLIPEGSRAACSAQLVELVEAADFHLDTGFLSLPFLLDVLVEIGRKDLAYRILLQDTAPSWLYEIAKGATTIWEDWRMIGADGSPRPLSFNHYAFGAVDDWLYRHVAGIQSVEPGYKRVVLAPDPDSPFGHVRARLETPIGPIAVALDRDADALSGTVEIPANMRADLRLADGRLQPLAAGKTSFSLAVE
ncbi:family 78 glycoside hydrolase catalytic domain [Sphingomonas tabacisoli]|uniref:alpha-L-rhamnosidase n=1 Tax=Sphingomonas tabacisoli TaxID=2249466 RepID=A0ABW4I2Q4_9SPHN